MPAFTFEIRDVFDLRDVEGITLIGPPLEDLGGLAAGDILLVPTNDGQIARCECVGFPLLNLGRDRVSWVRVSVSSVSLDTVMIGSRAIKAQ